MEIWIVACAAGALLGRVGLALYTCGLVRAKNAGGSLLRHMSDLCLGALAFWAIGMAILAPGEKSHVLDVSYLFGLRGPQSMALAPYMFLSLSGALLASGIVVGTLSERSRFWPSMLPAFLLNGLLVPTLERGCLPHGWLGRMGFHDAAGASFIHLTAGLTAAVGALAVGPRMGKYNRDGSSSVIPGHNLPVAGAGGLLFAIAWFPYLLGFVTAAGSSHGLVGLNALLALAAAGAGTLAVAHYRYGKPDIYLTLTGLIGGLVAITAGADVMSNLCAVITGAIAGIIVPLLLIQVDLVWRIDDPTGAIVIHGVGAATGILATGLFAPTTMGRLKFLGIQALGLAAVTATVLVVTTIAFLVLKRVVRVRAREEDEFDGLDLAEHDIGSYPDFQQNMIKSYHLREA